MAQNKIAAAAYARKYYLENRAKLSANNKAYRQAHSESYYIYAAAYRESHKEEAREYAAAYRLANPRRCKERSMIYKRANPEIIRASNSNRKARLRGAEGRHTCREWLDICDRFGNKCAHCESTGPLTKDHIIPVCLGGSNYAANIQPLCMSCNCRKGKRMPCS
jgi:5-methylcytosine-specific restriction endonuclease McrA